MQIAQATTMNWGGLPNMDYTLGPYTLLAGETGSGKTSFIDIVVAVLSGGAGGSRQSKFNVAQNQLGLSAKKSRRNLASYITGSDGFGNFLRLAGAHGYVAVAWVPDPHDGSYGTPFTAIVGAEATVDRDPESRASLNSDVARILVRGHVVTLSDLVTDRGTVRPAADLVVSLRAKYGSASVRDFKSAAEYLGMLYAYLKGDTSPVSRDESDQAWKAFASAIAYRQPDDIDGLIRDEILDNVDNEGLIQRLMETIREVNRLKTESARMGHNIQQLEATDAELRKAFEAFMDERMFRALVDIRRADEVREQLAAKSSELDRTAQELSAVVKKIEHCDREQDKRQSRLADLRLRISKDDAVTKKDGLERFVAEQERNMADVLGRIGSATSALAGAWRDAKLMGDVVDAVPDLMVQRTAIQHLQDDMARVSLPQLEAAVQAVQDGLGETALPELMRGCSAIAMALTTTWATAVNGEHGLRAAFNQAYRLADHGYEEVSKQITDIRRRAEKLKTGEVEYPASVELFLTQLRRELPACNARVLCDVVEIVDPAWQPALEGYLGRDRFTILYDIAYETRVVTLAKAFRRATPGHRGDISVPQLSLAIEDHPRVEDASIVHLFKVKSDEAAAGYLKARYGRTKKVADTTTLKMTRSGVMQDGWSTQGYRYQQRRCADEDLVIGADIRRQQRETLLAREKELTKELETLVERRRTLNKAIAIAGPPAILLTPDDPKKLDEAAQLRVMAKQELNDLDLSSVADLMQEVEALEQDHRRVGGEIGAMREQKGGFQTTVQRLEGELQELTRDLAEHAPKADAAREGHEALMKRAFFAHDVWPSRFADELKAKRTIESYDGRAKARILLVTNGVNDVSNRIGEYNRSALDFQQVQIGPFHYDSRWSEDTVVTWLTDVSERIREQVRSQRDTGLPERRLQCEMAERSFTSSFTTDFCATVLSNVEGRDDTIATLNANLERINFGGDQYRLISNLKPEYSDYIDLFRRIRSLSEARRADLDLFKDGDFSPAERDTLNRIRDLLLDDRDTANALEELRRIADYRNYRTYDFTCTRRGNTVALSRWGTGSGGESETPVYVIRVAVMASAFKLFSQQKKAHFRSIFMDEVFATMDEARTRRVLRFLKDLGLQVVCAAPTRSMAAVLDEFDTRINFSKFATPGGDRSDVNVINLHQDRVRALYDAHRGAVTKGATAAFSQADATADGHAPRATGARAT